MVHSARCWKLAKSLTLALAMFSLATQRCQGQTTLVARPLAPLKTVKVPLPSNLNDFIQDRQAAIALGKAFFGTCKLVRTV